MKQTFIALLFVAGVAMSGGDCDYPYWLFVNLSGLVLFGLSCALMLYGCKKQ